MSVIALVRAVVIALALLPAAGALTASADDGRSPAGQTGRPPSPSPVPLTQLRPGSSTPPPALLRSFEPDPPGPVELRPPSAKELVIFVGGYGSTQDDRAFDVLRARFPSDRFDVVRFGDDPRFPYDTYGPIDTSAAALTAQIRAAAATHSDVHIVSHSMGGNVVDRAFASGLSAADGVRTDIAIAAPHNGAVFAKVPTSVLGLIGPVRDIVRAIAVTITRDPDTHAARDLATTRPIAPPPGVVRLDLSLATDGLVNMHDALDPGVQQRVYLPASPAEALDGHGGSLTNKEIGGVIAETIATRQIPADHRDVLTLLLAPIVWDYSERAWVTVLMLAALGALSLAAVRFLPGCRYVIDRVALKCREYLRTRGR
jgi:hypothetical protein